MDSDNFIIGDYNIGSVILENMSQVSFKMPWGKLRGISMGNRSAANTYLCVHGWQDNAGLYRPLLSNLPQDNHYVAIDLMGHGQSDPLPTGMMYNFNNFGIALHHVIDQLNQEKVNLIGHSLGGGVTGYYSSIFPEKVNQLILLDSGGMPLIREDYRKHTRASFSQYLKYSERPPAEYTREQIIERLQKGMSVINSSLTNEAIDVWFERGVRELENGKYILNRDYRLSLNTPSQMGFDQLETLWTTIAASDISVYNLTAAKDESGNNPNGVKVKGVTDIKNSKYLDLYWNFKT